MPNCLPAWTTRVCGWPPTRSASTVNCQESSEDFDEKEPGHRHMYSLYPGNDITWHKLPKITEAARVSLERRLQAGGAYTGWSRRMGDQLMGSAWGWRPRPRVARDADEAEHRPESFSILIPRERDGSFRSTVTLARPPPWPRCCCKAMMAGSNSCLRFRRLGRTAKSKGCELAAARNRSEMDGWQSP